MVEERCLKCGRLFFRAEIRDAVIEIKCPKCGYIQKIFKKPQKRLDFPRQPSVKLLHI
jgi:phage FluMu protein Com